MAISLLELLTEASHDVSDDSPGQDRSVGALPLHLCNFLPFVPVCLRSLKSTPRDDMSCDKESEHN